MRRMIPLLLVMPAPAWAVCVPSVSTVGEWDACVVDPTAGTINVAGSVDLSGAAPFTVPRTLSILGPVSCAGATCPLLPPLVVDGPTLTLSNARLRGRSDNAATGASQTLCRGLGALDRLPGLCVTGGSATVHNVHPVVPVSGNALGVALGGGTTTLSNVVVAGYAGVRAVFVNGGSHTFLAGRFDGTAAGAVSVGSGTVTFDGTQFAGNSAAEGGALRVSSGNVVVDAGTVFDGNTATSSGGAIYATGGGLLTIHGATFSGNRALSQGGAVWFVGSDLTIDQNTRFTANAVDGAGTCHGGAVWVTNATLRITGATFTDNLNTAGCVTNEGGSLWALNSTVVLTDVSFVGNPAVVRAKVGGFLYQASGSLEWRGGSARGGRALNDGGAVALFSVNPSGDGTLIRGVAMDANGALPNQPLAVDGGFIYMTGSTGGTIRDVSFTGGAVTGRGVALSTSSTSALRLFDDVACGAVGRPAVFVGGTGAVELRNNVFYGNVAGAYEQPTAVAPLRVIQNTFVHNDGAVGSTAQLVVPRHIDLWNNIVVASAPTEKGLDTWASTGCCTGSENLFWGWGAAAKFPEMEDQGYFTQADRKNVYVDPRFRNLPAFPVDGTDCADADFRLTYVPAPHSPAIDEGAPSTGGRDPDLGATLPDLGAYGGNPANWDDDDADADGVDRWIDCDDTTAAIGEPAKYLVDADEDGYGIAGTLVYGCGGPPAGGAVAAGDCDDTDDTVNPGEGEVCDGADQDCDGSVDEGAMTTFFADVDNDGHGDGDAPVQACAETTLTSAVGDDCDDGDASQYPGRADVCDEVDNDCNGTADDDPAQWPAWFVDGDGDGLGLAAGSACMPGTGASATGGDCDDGNAAIGAPMSRFADGDGDGYGDAAVLACPGDPAADVGGDCADGDETRNPGADERCDALDDDCDGLVDEADAVDAATWYADGDDDGYGAGDETALGCAAPVGYVATADDCDDADPDEHPGAVEDCSDLVDRNCDGAVGRVDGDGDGFAACEECDDTSKDVFPGQVEACNGVDDDCDGEHDEPGATGEQLWYADLDGDGYGHGDGAIGCAAPGAGYGTLGGDCNDGQTDVFPGADEVPGDGVDQDCDGADATDTGIDSAIDTDPPIDTAIDTDPPIDTAIDTADTDGLEPEPAHWLTGGGCGCGSRAPSLPAAAFALVAALAWQRRRR